MNKPLKGKECQCYEGLMFTKEDVTSAVQWLKNILNEYAENNKVMKIDVIQNLINKAFSDVTKQNNGKNSK